MIIKCNKINQLRVFFYKKYAITESVIYKIREIYMKKAFTLAEVLITLMIIGIVAALTIPSVISNYQQQEFKTGLKKAVSILNEAIQTNITQDGETPLENVYLQAYLMRHMNVIKTAQLNRCYNSSSKELIKLDENQLKCDDQSGTQAVFNNAFYTADGMRFEFATPNDYMNVYKNIVLYESGLNLARSTYQNNRGYDCPWEGACYNDVGATNGVGFCGSYGLANNPSGKKNVPCLVTVDVNGDKKPNPPMAFDTSVKTKECSWMIGGVCSYPANQSFEYTYPSPTDKKLSDIFTIMITDEKAIPFGVVAQRAMYSK